MATSSDQIIEVKQGESRWFRFTVTDEDGNAVDLTGKTLQFGVKLTFSDASYTHEVTSNNFDRTQEASGIVMANLPASVTETLEVGEYIAEFKAIIIADTDVEKSEKFIIQILPSVIHAAA